MAPRAHRQNNPQHVAEVPPEFLPSAMAARLEAIHRGRIKFVGGHDVEQGVWLTKRGRRRRWISDHEGMVSEWTNYYVQCEAQRAQAAGMSEAAVQHIAARASIVAVMREMARRPEME